MRITTLFKTLTGESAPDVRKTYQNKTVEWDSFGYRLINNDTWTNSEPETIKKVTLGYDGEESGRFVEITTDSASYFVCEKLNEIKRVKDNCIEAYTADGEIGFILTKK